MHSKAKRPKKAAARTKTVSEILIDKDGRLLTRNMPAELLEVLQAAFGEDAGIQQRYRKLEEFRKPKGA